MSFMDWLFSSYPNPHIDGQWGLLHIITLVLIAAIVVAVTLLLKNKGAKTKKTVIWILVGLLILFEVARRVINFCKTDDLSFGNILYILLPRPGCAIASFLVILAACINKKTFYNLASIMGIICVGIFFIYPGVGFNNEFILFENLYSIVTHSLIMTVAILFITLKFTDFKYKTMWKDLICIAIVFAYAFLEIFVLNIESDPLYFMPGSDIQNIIGLSYGAFLPLYIVVFAALINIFYLIGDRKNVFRKRIK